MIYLLLTIVFLLLPNPNLGGNCAIKSVTTASGSHAPAGPYCPGDLIFEDNFNYLDKGKWSYENTLSGGGNWEFQWYTIDPKNTYTQNGVLKLRPTLLADEYGNDFLYGGTIDVTKSGYPCTQSFDQGCKRTGNSKNILNPIKSGKIKSTDSFSFKYGTIVASIKVPSGDWLWPAFWMLPKNEHYGPWPKSGEIDIMESRGNRNLRNGNNQQMGVQVQQGTLHWGASKDHDPFMKTHYEVSNSYGWDDRFHEYKVEWNLTRISFYIDDYNFGTVTPPAGGFYELGGSDFNGLPNIWKSGSHMAPFDQEFYIMFNLAVGGVGFFPDEYTNPGGKPWKNTSPTAAKDFWENRNQWLPTWDMKGDKSTLQVDWVRVYAL